MDARILAAALLLAACSSGSQAPPAPAPAVAPLASEQELISAEAAPLQGDAAAWNERVQPVTVIGNIHYVGVAGVSSFLITTPDGHFLLDGGLPQTAPIILRNIRELGFDIRDVKYVLNSHAHFDHAGGLARLVRESGGQMVASAGDQPTLEAGRITYGPSANVPFPRVRIDRVIADRETLTLGGVTLTAYLTPGHTAGCTSWSMPVTGADGAQHTAFFHCSATVAGQSLAPPAYPNIVADFRRTFARVGDIQADVFLANHSNFFGLRERSARLQAGDANAFVDAGALQRFNAQLAEAFETELARQQAAAN